MAQLTVGCETHTSIVSNTQFTCVEAYLCCRVLEPACVTSQHSKMSLTSDVHMTILCVRDQMSDTASICDDARHASCAPDMFMWSTYWYSQNYLQRLAFCFPKKFARSKILLFLHRAQTACFHNFIKLLEFEWYSNHQLLIYIQNINQATSISLIWNCMQESERGGKQAEQVVEIFLHHFYFVLSHSQPLPHAPDFSVQTIDTMLWFLLPLSTPCHQTTTRCRW